MEIDRTDEQVPVEATVSHDVLRYLDAARAENTNRAYASDMRHFAAWAEAEGRPWMPATPETVAEYLAAHAERYSMSTLGRRLSAISQAHQVAGHPSPTVHPGVKQTWKGIRRTVAREAPERARRSGKDPLSVEELAAIVAEMPETTIGARDRALLLLGFAAGLRRSELAGLDIADITHVREGLVLEVRRSKTDQEGLGRKVGVPYGQRLATCPVRATDAWTQLCGAHEGPLFRTVDRHGNIGGRLSDRAVAEAVKRSAARAGLDPARFSGHSLRAGFATAAARAGKSERAIAAQTGHRSVTVLRGYIRDGSLFRDNAASGIGL